MLVETCRSTLNWLQSIAELQLLIRDYHLKFTLLNTFKNSTKRSNIYLGFAGAGGVVREEEDSPSSLPNISTSSPELYQIIKKP